LPKDDPTSIGDILAKLKKKTKLGKQLDQAQIWERWPELIGEPLWPHGKPQKFKNQKLYIEAESPAWMHRFACHKWAIIKRINRLAGYELVNEIYISLSPDDPVSGTQDGA